MMAAAPTPAVVDADDGVLETTLAEVERQLAALGDALRARDAQAIDRHAGELQRALTLAVERFTQAARTRRVPQRLRDRLAVASGHMAAQRESLARATAALDRAIDVLMPVERGRLYGQHGAAERSWRGGSLQA